MKALLYVPGEQLRNKHVARQSLQFVTAANGCCDRKDTIHGKRRCRRRGGVALIAVGTVRTDAGIRVTVLPPIASSIRGSRAKVDGAVTTIISRRARQIALLQGDLQRRPCFAAHGSRHCRRKPVVACTETRQVGHAQRDVFSKAGWNVSGELVVVEGKETGAGYQRRFRLIKLCITSTMKSRTDTYRSCCRKQSSELRVPLNMFPSSRSSL